ncbi:FkbM family methyltransferase [Lachnospiraceae bacterium NSJ-143]|nr:FkbM family methyltransferase [Lachnospiraceae bacterium NSJ-143]
MENNLSKKYIRNRLKVGRAYINNDTGEGENMPVKRYIDVRGLSSEDAEKYIVIENYGIKGKLIRFAFRHKETIKSIPYFGKRIIGIKNKMLKSSVSVVNEAVDISPYFGLYKTDFIAKIYEVLLQRQVDDDGMNSCLAAMRNGASKGAIVYIVYTSQEFAKRFKVLNIEQYKKEYKKYVNKTRINRIPVFGRALSVYTLKGQIGELYDRLERAEAVSNYSNGLIIEKIEKGFADINYKIDVYNVLLKEYIDKKSEDSAEFLTDYLEQKLASHEKLMTDYIYEKINDHNLVLEEHINKSHSLLDDLSRTVEILNNNETLINIKNVEEKIDKTLDIQTGISEKSDLMMQIQTGLSEKSDLSLNIQTELSQKLDNLPQFIAGIGLKNKSMVTSVNGGVIAVNADDFIFGVPSEEWGLAMFLSTYGHFEYGTETLFESIVEEGMSVLDIGANLGMFTLRALRKGAVVYAYEPTPSIFKILEQNIKNNGFNSKVALFNNAVFNEEKTIEFSITEGTCGQSNNLFSKEGTLGSVMVKTVVIDEHLKHVEKIDIIKMDIEGSEYFALKGMRKTIEKNPQIKIIMEFAPGHLKRADVKPIDLIDLIEEYGLEFKEISENDGTLKDISRSELEKAFSINLLLTRKEV